MVHGYSQLILARNMAPQADAHRSDEALLDDLVNLAEARLR